MPIRRCPIVLERKPDDHEERIAGRRSDRRARYKVTAFHHAVESYKIADLLKASGTCSAIWADWWGFKMESYDGIPENAALLQNDRWRAAV